MKLLRPTKHTAQSHSRPSALLLFVAFRSVTFAFVLLFINSFFAFTWAQFHHINESLQRRAILLRSRNLHQLNYISFLFVSFLSSLLFLHAHNRCCCRCRDANEYVGLALFNNVTWTILFILFCFRFLFSKYTIHIF